MHFREYPLLNTPNMMVVILRAAAAGETSVEDCARRLSALLDRADEHPPVDGGEVRRRLHALRHCLTEAGLLTAADGERFGLTRRGREALEQHPAGFDTADLMLYPEFADYIHAQGRDRREADPRTQSYDEGFDAYRAGQLPTDNPHPPDSADHLAWENGWFEALDEDLD